MNKYLLLTYLACVVCFSLSAQETEPEQELPQEIESKYKFVFRQSAGIFIGQTSAGINATLNMQVQGPKLLGFGIDVTNGVYQSPNLNKNPSASEIADYDPTTDGPIPDVIVNGSDNDKYWGFSPYVSKGWDIKSWFSVELQGGPSLALIQRRTYSYSYVGPSGTLGGFTFPSGPFVSASSSTTNETAFGAYVRAYGSFKLGRVLSIDVSPFANFNNIENQYGVQLGIGLRF